LPDGVGSFITQILFSFIFGADYMTPFSTKNFFIYNSVLENANFQKQVFVSE